MKSTPDWRLRAYLDNELRFASRQSSVGIQAADLLAREAMKHLDNQCGPVQRPTRASIRTLANTNRFRFQYYVRVGLEALKREAEELGNLPGAKMSDYRAWLANHGRTDGISTRLNYLKVIDAMEREAKSNA
jgi:hypothetical protein